MIPLSGFNSFVASISITLILSPFWIVLSEKITGRGIQKTSEVYSESELSSDSSDKS